VVERLVEYLRIADVNVFFDLDTIEPGDDWAGQIQGGIKRASKFVIFWCGHAADSDYVQKEWSFALDNKKRIIPVLLDSTHLPSKLKRFQWLDFRDFGNALHAPLQGAGGAQASGPPGRTAQFAIAISALLLAALVIFSHYSDSVGATWWKYGSEPSGGRVVLLILMAIAAVGVFCVWVIRRKKLYHLMAEKLKERLQAEALGHADESELLSQGREPLT